MARRPTVELIVVDVRVPNGLPPRRDAPQVGIWWADDQKLAALVHSCQEAESGAGFLDSPLQHRTEWKRIAKIFGKSPHSDYFCVPRGRVLQRIRDECGVVYHGNATDQMMLQQIAAAFGLKLWRASVDDHYLFGDEADNLFDENLDNW